MAQRGIGYVTPERYFEEERVSAEKLEYVDGQIYAMSGGSLRHGRLIAALVRSLGNSLDGTGCETFGSEIKLRIDAANAYYYLDAMVVCGEVEVESETNGVIRNPIVVIEVLSPSTQDRDKNQKFLHYQTVSSIGEIVFLSSERKIAERYERLGDGSWRYTAYIGDVPLPIAAVRMDLDLADLYARANIPDSQA